MLVYKCKCGQDMTQEGNLIRCPTCGNEIVRLQICSPHGKQISMNKIKEEYTDKIRSMFDGRQIHADTEKYIIQFLETIALQRKTNKVSCSILDNVLAVLKRYPQVVIIQSLEKYLNMRYYETGKDERYALGIVRRTYREYEIKREKLSKRLGREIPQEEFYEPY